MARCAVIIINWNSWELLSRCLESLKKQTYRDFRVFIADNASEQPPPDCIFKILPGAVLFQNDSNYGFAKANNLLIKLAEKSEWIVLLNPDAFPQEDWLECLVKVATDYSQYSFFSSRLLIAGDPGKLDGDGDAYHVSGCYAWKRGHGKPAVEKSLPEEVFSACAAAAMYRTDAIIGVGGFDESYFCYFEDVDLGFRLRLAGHRCLLVPSAVVHHVGSATSGGPRSDFSVYHRHRNLVWTYIKDMPGALFWLFLPFHVLLNILFIFWSVIRGKGLVVLRAQRDAIKCIPAVWRTRRAIQSDRVASISEILRVLDKRVLPWID